MNVDTVFAVVAGAAIMLGARGSNETPPAASDGGNSTTTSVQEASDDGTPLWIKPDRVDCTGEAQQTCM